MNSIIEGAFFEQTGVLAKCCDRKPEYYFGNKLIALANSDIASLSNCQRLVVILTVKECKNGCLSDLFGLNSLYIVPVVFPVDAYN